MRTSNNWYPTNWLLAFFEFHYGYFNYHIEHHLFPSLKPSLLRRIAPVVRKVCRRHGVPYISTPFLHVQQSLLAHIAKMGLPHGTLRRPGSLDGAAEEPVAEAGSGFTARVAGRGFP